MSGGNDNCTTHKIIPKCISSKNKLGNKFHHYVYCRNARLYFVILSSLFIITWNNIGVYKIT